MNLPALGNGLMSSLARLTTPRAEPRPVEAAAPTTEDAALLDLIERRYRYARDGKRTMLERWATCLAFYVGEQWRKWDDKSQRLVKRTEIPSWRVLPQYNQIPTILDGVAGKLARTREMPQAQPDDEEDEEDRERGRKATFALQGWLLKQGWDELEHEANLNRILFGAAFPHLYWDPAKVAKVAVPGPPALDPRSGQPVPTTRAAYAPVGDLCVEVLTVFDVFPEPGERFADASYLLVARRKPLWWFRDKFANGGQVRAEKGDAESAMQALLPGIEWLGSEQGAAPAPDGDGTATLKIYYERSCKQFPQGRTVYAADKLILFKQDSLPLWSPGVESLENPLPVKMIAYRHVPKRLWPKGLIEECLSPQQELNRGLGNLAEIMRLYRSPKWFIAKRWHLKPTAITSAPDEVVEGDFNPGEAPQPISPPTLPAWLQGYHEMQRNELREVSGLAEVSEGTVPSGVQAASAIALLQQADNNRLSAPALLGKVGWEAVMTHALAVLAERYREPRQLAVPAGGSGGRETGAVLGSDFGPREVIIQLTQGIEDNPAVRGQQLNEWLASGLWRQPLPTQLRLLRSVGMGWLADDLEASFQESQQFQAQQALRQAGLQAALAPPRPVEEQPDPNADPRLLAQREAAQMKGQERAAAQAHEAHQNTLSRRHDVRMAKLTAAARSVGGKR